MNYLLIINLALFIFFYYLNSKASIIAASILNYLIVLIQENS